MRSDPFADEMDRLGSLTDWTRDDAPSDEPQHPVRSRLRGPHSARPWPEADLTLLGTGRRPAPEFPLPLLGSWAEWVTTKANGASAPVDYVAVALLGSMGAALANVRWPVAGAGWSEPTVLWCAEVGPPSSSKSPSMNAAFDLVRFAEDRMGLGFEAEQKKFATQRQTSEAHMEAWKAAVKTAVKNGGPPPSLGVAGCDAGVLAGPHGPGRHAGADRLRTAD
jgi:hypothetical protein